MSQYGKFPTQAAFDAEVARLYHLGRDDLRISISTEMSCRAVGRSRKRQDLPTKYAPGGKHARAWKQRGMAPR